MAIQPTKGRDMKICRCDIPAWVRGMCYVSDVDVREVYESLTGTGLTIEDESCGGVYHPDYSFDPYA